MKWNVSPVATWSAYVPIDSDSNIVTMSDVPVLGQKSFTFKGQNPNTTEEDDDYGNIGNTFAKIFGMTGFNDIKRKVTDELEVDE